MKKGFTMIELIFVIVILGILAAVAIPRLAATRDDATLAGIKTDVATALQAVPAWYQGQKDARIDQAMQLDQGIWTRNSASSFTWNIATNDPCISIAVYDMNDTGTGTLTDNGIADAADINTSTGAWTGTGVPVLRVLQGDEDGANLSTDAVCATLWATTGLNMQEANITMAGRRVQW